jgi:hypothetical protein
MRKLSVFGILAVLCIGRVAFSEIIQVEFNGTVSSVPSELLDSFSNGDTMSGRYTIDTTQAVGDNWVQSIVDMQVDIAGKNYGNTIINGDVEVGGNLADYVAVGIVDGMVINGYNPILFSIQMDLIGPPDPLTPVPPTIAAVNSADWSLVFQPDVVQLGGTIDRIAVVPEPNTAVLSLMGLVVLGLIRRHRRLG